jgi:hypothetical protein
MELQSVIVKLITRIMSNPYDVPYGVIGQSEKIYTHSYQTSMASPIDIQQNSMMWDAHFDGSGDAHSSGT